MKIRYQILIIFLVLFCSFIVVKDDIIDVINKNFLKNNNQSIVPKKSFNDLQNEELLKSISTPGALKIENTITQESNSELSIKNIISITNKLRKQNGSLIPLIEQNKLNKSAEKKLQDMFQNEYFEHISPYSGQAVGDLAEESGYDYILIGENLAMGNFKDDLSLMNAWMASSGHRENILNKNYREIGVAVGKGTFNGKNIWMAVQHFGTPDNICPSIDKVLLGRININQEKIDQTRKELLLRKDKIDQNFIYQGNSLNEQIDIYNDLVIYYNNLLIQTEKDTAIYNNQIKIFNQCLINYQ